MLFYVEISLRNVGVWLCCCKFKIWDSITEIILLERIEQITYFCRYFKQDFCKLNFCKKPLDIMNLRHHKLLEAVSFFLSRSFLRWSIELLLPDGRKEIKVSHFLITSGKDSQAFEAALLGSLLRIHRKRILLSFFCHRELTSTFQGQCWRSCWIQPVAFYWLNKPERLINVSSLPAEAKLCNQIILNHVFYQFFFNANLFLVTLADKCFYFSSFRNPFASKSPRKRNICEFQPQQPLRLRLLPLRS